MTDQTGATESELAAYVNEFSKDNPKIAALLDSTESEHPNRLPVEGILGIGDQVKAQVARVASLEDLADRAQLDAERRAKYRPYFQAKRDGNPAANLRDDQTPLLQETVNANIPSQ